MVGQNLNYIWCLPDNFKHIIKNTDFKCILLYFIAKYIKYYCYNLFYKKEN